MKNILFVASECAPFVKTGGLADVTGALPKMFDKNQFDVRVIIPNYSCIPWDFRKNFKYVHHFYMDMGYCLDPAYVGIMTWEFEGITYYFVDNECYFSGWTPYGDIRFDIEKFNFFSKAVLAILPVIEFQPDVIHCHDWQAGMVPVYLRTLYKDNNFYWKTKAIMTIHNLRFQGIWDKKTVQMLSGLSDDIFTPAKLEYHGDANLLKGGLAYADFITTVSDTYAGEIQMPYYGEGLDGLMRHRNNALWGIVNGIDYRLYDPANDFDVYENYTVESFDRKAENKRQLQRDLGLPMDDGKMMIGIISRLTDQKGLDLINWVMDGMIDENVQLVVVGTGEARYEEMFRQYEYTHPDRVKANLFYEEAFAHKAYAACDALLMPSRFEPCGLSQLIALRYGTVPIVRETGGLRDTVIAYNEFENSGTGFSFTNYNADEMLDVINYAKNVYFNHPARWEELAIRGMEADYSWGKSAKKYADLYCKVIGY